MSEHQDMEYAKARDIVVEIYELFEYHDVTVPEGMTVLVMAMVSIADDFGIPLDDIITGIKKHNEAHLVFQKPHGTVQ